MKREFRAHPLMIFSIIKPFLFVLFIPVIKGLIQYISKGKITGFLTLEIIFFAVIIAIACIRCMSFRLICDKNIIIYKIGVVFFKKTIIDTSKLSSVQTFQNPIDAAFHSVTYCINTEAGRKYKSDLQFKLSQHDSSVVSEILYGKKQNTAVKFSVFKVAIMAATTSSAVTGIFIGVPIINRTGNLLGLALNNILLNEINSVSESAQTYFPPIVNAITILFLIFYTISFMYSLLKYINFRLFLDSDRLEIRSGFFIRTRTAFKKSSVNNVKIDQTPLMRLFKIYSMKVSVGGYGDSKSASEVIVPSGRRGEIKRQFSLYFPFLIPDGKIIHATRSIKIKNRFLFWPTVYFILLIAVSITTSVIFEKFGRVILFLSLVLGGIILYYAFLCVYEYRFGKIKLGYNIFAQTVKGFNTCEMYCPKENIGQIKIIRSIPDHFQGTCDILIRVRSENSDSIKVRHLDYKTVLKEISKCYGINQ